MGERVRELNPDYDPTPSLEECSRGSTPDHVPSSRLIQVTGMETENRERRAPGVRQDRNWVERQLEHRAGGEGLMTSDLGNFRVFGGCGCRSQVGHLWFGTCWVCASGRGEGTHGDMACSKSHPITSVHCSSASLPGCDTAHQTVISPKFSPRARSSAPSPTRFSVT